MKILYSSLALFVIVSLLLLFNSRLSELFDSPAQNSIIKDGLSIAMSITPVSSDKNLRESQDASLQFTIQNAASKQPVKGLYPAVWLERQNPQEKNLSCRERVNSYLQSQMTFKPEISLNAYFVLALNNNASISVIDPINGFGGSKLIAQIKLNSPGVDWALSKDHKRLYVATPLARQVAVVDTQTWKAISFLPFDAAPTRLALQPDGQYLWVGMEDKAISVVDTEKLELVKSLATGAGHHEFAFSDDSRSAYVSNQNGLTIIDIEHLSINQTVKSPTPPVALAFSTLSKTVYVATENGSVLVINANGQTGTPIETGSPLKTLRFSADGRWGFALSQTDNKVFIIDASLNRLLQTVELGAAPDQISFTDNFVYIRSTSNETVSMLSLDALSKNRTVSVTTFPGGQSAPAQSELLLTDAIVPTPERNAVVVANPTDKSIYYYTEGMAAPMGNFENQGLKPMAVMIVNRSMQETSPGVYTGITQLPPAGNYSVAILLDNPAVYHCFSTSIAANPGLVKQGTQAVTVDYLLDNKDVAVGAPVTIKLKLNHAVQDSVNDLQVLVFRIPGLWQQRIVAKPLGNSLYQVEVTPPEIGVYQLSVQSPSLAINFNQQPMLTFRATGKVSRQ